MTSKLASVPRVPERGGQEAPHFQDEKESICQVGCSERSSPLIAVYVSHMRTCGVEHVFDACSVAARRL